MPDAAHHEDAKRERYSKMLYIKAVKKRMRDVNGQGIAAQRNLSMT
jgi:hypothetical protein